MTAQPHVLFCAEHGHDAICGESVKTPPVPAWAQLLGWAIATPILAIIFGVLGKGVAWAWGLS